MTYPYEIESYSSYNDWGIGRYVFRTNKPDICAPGNFAGITGTSYSTPLVTATIALICDYRPYLKTRQHTVKAILAASTGKETRKYVSDQNDFAIYGAGIVDARAAIWLIKRERFTYQTGSISARGEIKRYEMEVSSSDTRMRVALAYANRVEYSQDGNHLNVNLLNGYIGKLDLEVYDPNGNLVAACYSENLSRNANLKIVEFMPNGVYGDYTIKITVVQRAVYSSNDTINFGVAWR